MNPELPTAGHRYKFVAKQWGASEDMDIIVLHAAPDSGLIHMIFANVKDHQVLKWFVNPEVWKERWERIA